MKNRIKASISVLVVFILLAGAAYVNTYYRASEEALSTLTDVKEIDEDVLVFEPKCKPKAGLIFYPGGKVEYTAYAPLLQACAEEGILCVLIKMPCNLAVLDIKAADGIKEKFPKVKNWYMAGHSLGGSMAAAYAGENSQQFEGVILLASYSTKDLSASELEVLSIYGTEDKVLNKESYIENIVNLPKDYHEFIIEGGCHAYFGNYGYQEGDGEAQITRENQQRKTICEIIEFLEN